MDKEDYNKLSTYDKIDYDIQMELYCEFNDKIATINDHLGELYGYSDLKNAEEAEKEAEIRKYQKALKDKCDAIDKAIEYTEDKKAIIDTNVIRIFDLFEIEEQGYKDKLLEILRGESNE